jgi:hypothetical protein
MSTARAQIRCPKCRTDVGFDMSRSRYILRRESEFRVRETELQAREQRLRVRETEHEGDVRLIKNCLHPDKHPDQAERYTRAWQAFERLLASATRPESVAPAAADFSDDIPF